MARALRLNDDERHYLFTVAGHNAAQQWGDATHVAPTLMRVLDRLSDTPAMVISDLGEVLVQNDLAAALFGDSTGYTGWTRSMIYRWFTDPAERLHYPEGDRSRQSRAHVANLRAVYGSLGPQSRAGRLIEVLQEASEEFTRLWARQEVAKRFADHKTVMHPELGAIEVDCQVLFTEDQAQALLVLTAPPRSEGAAKLELLAALGRERWTAGTPPHAHSAHDQF